MVSAQLEPVRSAFIDACCAMWMFHFCFEDNRCDCLDNRGGPKEMGLYKLDTESKVSGYHGEWK